MKSLIFLNLIFFLSNAFAESHFLGHEDSKSLSELISERCINVNEDKTLFFKELWRNDSYIKEVNANKSDILSNPCLSEADKIHLEIYRQRNNAQILISAKLGESFEQLVSLEQIPFDLFQLFIVYQSKIKFVGNDSVMSFWKTFYAAEITYFNQVYNPPFISAEELNDLYNQSPDRSQVLEGKYHETLRLFLFCRRDRNYHCLFTAKDKFDRPLENANGKIWSQPALAQSARNLPSNIVNGQTPQGVHTIDSVMPEADQFTSFGKYRRVILNWVPKIEEELDEETTKMFLSPLSDHSFWWRQASISRDVGRSDLRIHGTGKLNNEPESTRYPFRNSNGCITQREGRYSGVDYQDQRIILDQLMKALELPQTFENEENIVGTLYLIELDDQNKHVTWEEVSARLGLNKNPAL